MARFTRGNEHVELVLDGRTVIEGNAFGPASRELHDERAARIAYYQRIAELLDDRWARQTPFVDDLIPVDEPPFPIDDDADASVYTDWLIERGDPRGELAALRAAETPDARAIASLEKTRGLELFGPLAMLGRPWREQIAYTWRRGWVDEITFVHHTTLLQPGEVMQHALHAPMARFARWLTLDTWYQRVPFECLTECTCLEQIRGVRIANGMYNEELLAVLPNLEELELLDSDRANGGHPNVQRLRLTIDTGPVSITGEWPVLRRLDLVFTNEIGTARGMLDAMRQPTLREVRIDTPGIPSYVASHLDAMRDRLDIQITIRPRD